MTYAEAIDVIKRELICERMTKEECGAVGDCKNCSGGTTDEERKEALETIIAHADKYRWHDRRKDPNDLPEKGTRFIICTKNGYVECGDFLKSDGRFVGDLDEHAIKEDARQFIAWRHIEPFGEVD